MGKYSQLFQPLKVGGALLKNRIVMPPMDTNYAAIDGTLSRKSMSYYLERAKGGVGLIIVEATAVDWPNGKISERQLKMNDYSVTPEWHDLTDAVHSFGTKIICQLHHGGLMAVPDFCNGVENVSSSATGTEGSPFYPAREMTTQEVKDMVQKFIKAAVIAKRAGLDGVEIHAAHAYLLNQFISPLINRRTDEYGGSFEGRARMLLEIIEGVRKECPAPFLLSVRLAVMDHIPGGLTTEDGVKLAKLCEAAGADMINTTIGFYTTVSQSTESQWDLQGQRLPLAAAVKKAVTTAKVAAVGKLRDPALCEAAVANGDTDLVCIGRQLICDPFWPEKLENGLESQLRPCLNCDDGCMGQFYFNHGNVHCTLNPYVGYEDLHQESNVTAAGTPRSIVVVGGGVAGMQTAIIARKRGHQVTLLEKSGALGGQLIIAGVPPHKEDLVQGNAWFAQEVYRLGIKVLLNTAATADLLAGLAPDAVVVATGSRPGVPPIPGIEKAHDSWSVLDGSVPMPEGKKVVVIGGGTVGSETAHMLLEKGNEITILERLDELCVGHEIMHKSLLTEALNQDAHVELQAQVVEVRDNAVVYKDASGSEKCAESDVVIYSTGQRPNGAELYEELQARNIRVYKVGDSKQIGNIRSATRSAMDLAYML